LVKHLIITRKDDKKGISGGVEEIGNFIEGYCFKLQGSKKNDKFRWIVCSESYVINFKLKYNRNQSIDG